MIREREVIQPERTVAGVRYAGFWTRFAAFMIDAIILGVIGSVLTGIFWPWEPSGHSGLGTLLAWLYFAGMESSTYQATIGKMIMGIRVTDLAGQRITFARATVRYFAKIISALILLLGFLMAAWTERKQALHDMIAGTLVLSRAQ